jgi:ankyrin repeat protein
MATRTMTVLVGIMAVLVTSPCWAATRQEAPKVPLIEAVKKGDLAAAKQLLEGGADPNVREILLTKPSLADRDEGGKQYPGDTALGIAIEKKNVQLVKLLLDFKADVNRPGVAECPPLMDAIHSRRVDLVKLLLQRGAKPNQGNVYGDTAIVSAANSGQTQLIELLLQHGADINGGKGWTALSMAAYCRQVEVVKLLIKRGADVNLRRGNYMTPLECAEAQGGEEVAAIIRKAGGKGRSRAVIEKESERASKRWREEEAKSRPPARDRELTDDDRQIIELALLDMLSYKGKDLWLVDKGKNIVLVNKTAGGSGFPLDDQLNSELDEKKANELTLEIRQHIAERNGQPMSLTTFRPKSPSILLWDEKTRSKEFSPFGAPPTKARAWVMVYLPGYTKQRDKAVLRFYLGPTPHGAAGTYFLVKQDGKWQVKWRDFAFYL